MQDRFGAVDVIDKAFYAAGKRKVFFLAGALVDQANLHAIVQERKFAQALGEDFKMPFDRAEDFFVSHEVHFCAALFSRAEHLQRRGFDTVDDFDFAVNGFALIEFKKVLFAVAANGEAQPLRERVHARNAHAVQPAGNLVAVLVELAARVQHAHDDFGGRALGFVLVIELHAGRNAATVVGDRNRIVGVDGHDDVVAMAGQRFVNRVIDHFEHHMVQTGAIAGIADIHAGAFADRLQTFKLLDGVFVVAGADLCGSLRQFVLLIAHFLFKST